MLTKTQQDKIARKFTAVVIKAMDLFPELLGKCEVEEAARVVADVIKAHIPKAMPEPLPEEQDPAQQLAAIVSAIAKSEDCED